MYTINEIFYSLQGEGYHSGTPAIFVRFAGCNLKCSWCDTDFHSFTQMTSDDIVNQCLNIAHSGTKLLILTGGEPSLQADDLLIQLLHEAGFYIAIETNGTQPLPAGIDWVTCSPKANSQLVLTACNELKIVYTGQDVEQYHQKFKAEHFYLQPCSQQNTQNVVDYILQHPHWHLSLQTHKYINIR